MNGPTMRRRGEGSARRTWNPFPRSRVGATITSSGSPPIAPPSLLRHGRRRTRAPQRRGCGRSGDGRQAALAQRVVQLPAQRSDARLLVLGGLALVAQQRSVELIGVLADALLAGDGAALLGGDDLPPHLFQLLAHRREAGRQRVALGELAGPLRRALLCGVD